jgi:hypothetical protein
MNQDNEVPTFEPSLDTNKETSEDLRVGYVTAVQMAIYDGQLSWQITGIFVQFGILMIVGAVFPSFVGSTNDLIIAFAGLMVSIAGIILTSMFGSMVMRVRTFEGYWVLRATQLESQMSDSVETLEGSNVLSSRGYITVNANTIRMPRIAAVKSKVMLGAFFTSFLLVFLGLFATNLWRLILAV